MDKLTWEAPEYEERERSPDWFWALGVIVVAVSLASVIYENYFFAVLIILGGVMLAFFARRVPDMVSYELNEEGFRTGPRLYPYENISAFWVETRGKFQLFVKTERFFLPVFSTNIVPEMADDIRAVFLAKEIPEVEMREHVSEKITDALGF
jgi:hypothetical protein